MDEDKQTQTIEIPMLDGRTVLITFPSGGREIHPAKDFYSDYQGRQQWAIEAVDLIRAALDVPDAADVLGTLAEKMGRVEHNAKMLEDAGTDKDELAELSVSEVSDTLNVAKELYRRGVAGYCAVSDELVERLRGQVTSAKYRQVKQTKGDIAYLADISRKRLDNTLKEGNSRPLTVDEAAQFAIAYGITPAEFLGFMDAEEVRLVDLWRGMDAEKRAALLTLLEPLA